MTDLERTIAAYAEFLDEVSLARSADHEVQAEDEQGDVIVVDIGTPQKLNGEKIQRKWLPFAVLAAAAVIVAIVAVAAFGGSEESSPVRVADSPDESSVPTDTVPGLDTSEPWDLVFISGGDHVGVADLWAERIEADLGVEVRVHDHALPGLGSAGHVLETVEDELSSLHDQIADAEVIAVFANPRGLGMRGDFETCVSSSRVPRDPPMRYSTEEFGPYRDALSSIWATVFELREGVPTVLRAMDAQIPVIDGWRAAGIDAECTAFFELLSVTARQAAAEFGVPLASMLDAFNGPDHDEDPRQSGLVDPGPADRPNEDGRAVLAGALHSLGYGPTAQPA